MRSSTWSGVREVSLLDWVEREVVELVLVGLGLGDRDGLPTMETFVALARSRPELPVVVVAGELDEVLLAVDVDLGDDRLDVVGLLDRRVHMQLPGVALEHAPTLRRSAAMPLPPAGPSLPPGASFVVSAGVGGGADAPTAAEW